MAETDIKKHQMEFIVIGTLVLLAFVIGITRFKKKDKDDEVFSRKEFAKKWEEVEILEKEVPAEEKGVVYTTESERAPFKSPFEGEALAAGEQIVLPTMTFQGMVWSSARPQAIIDNKVYDIGDSIIIGTGEIKEEVRVKDINRKGISLIYKGKEFLVRPK